MSVNGSKNVLSLLFVEDDYDYSRMLQATLLRLKPDQFEITHANQLNQALNLLAHKTYDAILLDLSLPDSDGLDTFHEVYSQAPDVPIVVLTAGSDESMGMEAVHEGAQDYLIKGSTSAAQLERAIQYAIQRHSSVKNLQHLSMIDELTGLLNRRGFLTIARQHLKIARRARQEMVLTFADLDHLKMINDQYGHQQGDEALKAIASILRSTFRSSDIVGRLGGDEFTVLAINASSDSADRMLQRLQEGIQQHNLHAPLYPLSLSLGMALFNPQSDVTLEELLLQADQALYIHKRSKQKT